MGNKQQPYILKFDVLLSVTTSPDFLLRSRQTVTIYRALSLEHKRLLFWGTYWNGRCRSSWEDSLVLDVLRSYCYYYSNITLKKKVAAGNEEVLNVFWEKVYKINENWILDREETCRRFCFSFNSNEWAKLSLLCYLKHTENNRACLKFLPSLCVIFSWVSSRKETYFSLILWAESLSWLVHLKSDNLVFYIMTE